MERFVQELRVAARALRKSPGFTAGAVLCLALGIGGNSAVYSLVHAVLLRDLPYRDPARVVMIFGQIPAQNLFRSFSSAAEFYDYRDRTEAFADVAALGFRFFNLTGAGEPERLTAARVSPGFFQLLGVEPALGRGFAPEEGEPGRSNVAVLSDALWRRRFGADPAIVGRKLMMSDEPFTVIGVMPAGFRFKFGNYDNELWVPLVLKQAKPARDFRSMPLVARLRDGVSLRAAQAQMDTLTRRFQREYPEIYAPGDGWRTLLMPVHEALVEKVRRPLVVIMAAVALLLLITCSNLANLLLSRIISRRREIAVWAALGAGRGSIIRRFLFESLLLALAGGALGLALASWGLKALAALQPAGIPRLDEIQVDPAVLTFTFLAAVATALLVGLLPALQGARPDLATTLRDAGKGASQGTGGRSLSGALVILQVAISFTVLIGAGLVVRSFLYLDRADPGFRSQGLLTFQLLLAPNQYPDPQQRVELSRRLAERLREVPGVDAVGFSNSLPFGELKNYLDTVFEGHTVAAGQVKPLTDLRSAGTGYPAALGIPLVQGRWFNESDDEQAPPVAVVDAALARRYWPGQNPLGKRLQVLGRPDGQDVWLTIVGVVGAVKSLGLDVEPREQVYIPYLQSPTPNLSIAVRTRLEPMSLAHAVREAVWAIDRRQALDKLQTMDQAIARSISTRRAYAVLLGLFALFSSLVAGLGVYGMINFGINQRRREIGIRMALGARSGHVLRLVVLQAVGLAGLGITLGLLLALFTVEGISDLLFGVAAKDLATFSTAVLSLLWLAVVAAYLPARRAMSSSPVMALREP